ncbi:MAG: ATP-binding protein [Candidatus Obscuribacterales bacterium]|nr:ATP-binding protein [Candidatus Obscuribacterales bacterium]
MTKEYQLFTKFKEGGLNFLKQLKDEETAESEILDFKRAETDSGPLTRKDLQNLSINLSGFANAEGGLIVWGIDCRSHANDDPDTVKELRPIKDVSLFYQQLKTKSAEVLSPGINGIEHWLIDSDQPDEGFVVTYVPRWDGYPQMATAKDVHRYYFRVGPKTNIMPPYVLADRFGRRPQPKLQATWFVSGVDAVNGIYIQAASIVLGIRNVGVGTANHPAISVNNSANDVPLDLHSYGAYGLEKRTHLRVSPNGRDPALTFFGGLMNIVIYPGMTLDFTTFTWAVGDDNFPDIKIPISYYCDSFHGSEELLICGSEIMEGLKCLNSRLRLR